MVLFINIKYTTNKRKPFKFFFIIQYWCSGGVCVILFCCCKVIWEKNGPKQFKQLLKQHEEETTCGYYNATRYPGYFFKLNLVFL